MRHLLFVIVVTAALLVAAPTALSQPAQAQPTNLKATLFSASATGSGTCCVFTWFFEGSASVPVLGAVTFEGHWSSGHVAFSDPLIRHEALSVRFVSRGGDTIELSGVTQWLASDPMPPLTWTVSEATGRFAAYTGSGTYTAEAVDGRVVIRLSGTLLRAG
jgi:hypothetical protein